MLGRTGLHLEGLSTANMSQRSLRLHAACFCMFPHIKLWEVTSTDGLLRALPWAPCLSGQWWNLVLTLNINESSTCVRCLYTQRQSTQIWMQTHIDTLNACYVLDKMVWCLYKLFSCRPLASKILKPEASSLHYSFLFTLVMWPSLWICLCHKPKPNYTNERLPHTHVCVLMTFV